MLKKKKHDALNIRCFQMCEIYSTLLTRTHVFVSLWHDIVLFSYLCIILYCNVIAASRSGSQKTSGDKSPMYPSNTEKCEPSSQRDQGQRSEDSSHQGQRSEQSSRQGPGPSLEQSSAIDDLRNLNIPGVEVFTPDDFNDLTPQEQAVRFHHSCFQTLFVQTSGSD